MSNVKPRILFVDDDAITLKALARSLRRHRQEWDLVFVESGEAAVGHVRERPFDVVVTDLAMPGMSGIELVQFLNENSRDTRCIILTGTADLQTAAHIINSVRVFRFYTKPYAAKILIDGIVAGIADASRSSAAPPLGDVAGDAVLNKLSTGIVVVTRKTEVLYMNQAAAETIAAADGLSVGHGHILRASSSRESGRLGEICTDLGGASEETEPVALSIARPSLRGDLKLVFAPLEIPDADAEGRVIVFVSNPDQQTFPKAELIARFFDLTPSESRLALELVRGKRTEEIAEALGITVSTVRTYLKKIMEKTGTGRQVELVRLLLSTPQVIP